MDYYLLLDLLYLFLRFLEPLLINVIDIFLGNDIYSIMFGG
jgi:hypothetical protein